ncbi:MAG: DUF4254 domain-containing protein [Janthinobacterium lividum]
MLDAAHIAALQEDASIRWHLTGQQEPSALSALASLVLEQHRANFDLWHCEDHARNPLSDHAAIAAVKRSIDQINQRRNDLVERLDLVLLAAVEQNNDAPLHSETPGLVIDRLSILSLKIFHTHEEAHRSSASGDHKLRNRERLTILQEQRLDLAGCLAALWTDIQAGRRRFKLYRQMKMYNDPTLNPVLYGDTGPGNGPPST